MRSGSETAASPVEGKLLVRLNAIERLKSGEVPLDAFSRLVRIATQVTGAPVGLAVLVGDVRQVFVAQEGLEEPWASQGCAPLSQSFCKIVAGSGEPLVVTDAREDERLRNEIDVAAAGVVAYAGMPMRIEGVCVGSLCVTAPQARCWSPRELLILGELADAATAELELHLAAARGAVALDRLGDSSERYRSLLSAIVDGVVLQDKFGAILECNGAAERIFGMTAAQMAGSSLLDRRWRSIHANGRPMPECEHPAMRTIETGQALRDQVMGVRRPGGEVTWISVCTEPLFDADGTTSSVVSSFTDITERVRSQQHRDQQLTEQQALRELATLVARQAPPSAVFAAAARHAAHVLDANAGGVARLGAEGTAALVGAWVPAHMVHPAIGEAIDLEAGTAIGSVLKTGEPASRPRPCAYLRRTGAGSSLASPVIVDGELWGALSVAYENVIDKHGTDEKLERLGRFADLVSLGISSAEARDQLAKQATIDHLTGLANQRTFSDRLDEAVRHAAQHEKTLSLVVFDIDHFKQVNDTHGHAAGNDVLVEFAQRLRAARRGSEVIARVGGEEFAWILPGTSRRGALAAAERVRRAVERTPFAGAGALTTSAGVCELSDAHDARQLFRHADMALYWAKSEGRNATFAYEPGTLEMLSGDEQARRLKDAATLAAIRALATAVDAKDASTQRHSERVADLVAQLAMQAGWPARKVALLRDAALVHDIGKIGVPDHVLLKAGKLTDQEYEQVKQHAALGAQMVSGILTPEQTEWIRHHHERFDGRGYPDQIAGTAISEGARLMALADSWDAMTVARPYGTPRTHADALAEIHRATGTQFCPAAVAHFVELRESGATALDSRPEPR